jgi:hypothetical protein
VRLCPVKQQQRFASAAAAAAAAGLSPLTRAGWRRHRPLLLLLLQTKWLELMGPRKRAPDAKTKKETAIEESVPRPPAAREPRKRRRLPVEKDGPDKSQNSKLLMTLQVATSDELLVPGSRVSQPDVGCNPQNDCEGPAMSAGCSKEEFSNTRQKTESVNEKSDGTDHKETNGDAAESDRLKHDFEDAKKWAQEMCETDSIAKWVRTNKAEADRNLVASGTYGVTSEGMIFDLAGIHPRDTEGGFGREFEKDELGLGQLDDNGLTVAPEACCSNGDFQWVNDHGVTASGAVCLPSDPSLVEDLETYGVEAQISGSEIHDFKTHQFVQRIKHGGSIAHIG